ncbi:MAG TPA: flagellar hook-length control protein FliK [bacterium]|nr:flagellar hook-length control protein FliK [bacterium]HQQ01191.1 flagellar hook-length control protein FliK [bacterium]
MVFNSLPLDFQASLSRVLELSLSRIAEGRPISGQVIADEGGGRATVLLGGRQFTLNLGTAQVSVGQSFTAQLIGGKLQIQFGNQSTSVPVESLIGQSTPRSLVSVLANLGAPTSAAAQAVAHSLLNSQIPLSAEAIRTLAALLPQLSATDVSTLSFLINKGMPISPSTIESVQRILDNRTKIGEKLAELDGGLGKLERQLDAIQDRVVAIQRRDELAERRRNLKQEYVKVEEEDSEEKQEELAGKLEKSVRGQSTSAEAALFSGAHGSRLGISLYDLYLYLLQLQQMQILGDEVPFSLLLQQVNELYESLAGQNLRNLPDEDPERPPTYFFQIPITLEGEDRTLELLYRQHSKNPEDGGVLSIRLDLSQFGPVKIDFNLREGMLSVTIVVSSAELKKQVEPEMDALKEALADAGFRVASVGVVHGIVPSTLREMAPQSTMPAHKPRGLDLRV